MQSQTTRLLFLVDCSLATNQSRSDHQLPQSGAAESSRTGILAAKNQAKPDNSARQMHPIRVFEGYGSI